MDPQEPKSTSKKESRWVFKAGELRYSTVFKTLFAHPKLATGMLTLRSFWLGTVVAAVLVCGIGGLLLTLRTAPDYGGDIRRATQFVLDQVGDTRIEDGRIVWKNQRADMPHAVADLKHCRVEIVGRWDGYTPTPTHRQTRGFVIAPEGIGFWLSDEDGRNAESALILPASRLPSKSSGVKIELTRETQSTVCKTIFASVFMGVLGSSVALLAKQLAITAFLLMAFWLFMGRIPRLSMLPRVFILGLNISLPPLVVSLVWAFAGISWGIDMLFCLAFVVYVVYASLEARSGELSLL